MYRYLPDFTAKSIFDMDLGKLQEMGQWKEGKGADATPSPRVEKTAGARQVNLLEDKGSR